MLHTEARRAFSVCVRVWNSPLASSSPCCGSAALGHPVPGSAELMFISSHLIPGSSAVHSQIWGESRDQFPTFSFFPKNLVYFFCLPHIFKQSCLPSERNLAKDLGFSSLCFSMYNHTYFVRFACGFHYLDCNDSVCLISMFIPSIWNYN